MKKIFWYKIIFSFLFALSLTSSKAQVMQDWVSFYDGPVNNEDHPKDIAIDSFGNVYVTGVSDGGSTANDYLTIKYNSSGDTIWVRRYDDPTGSGDGATAIAVDLSGNVFVTGGSAGDVATLKYNSTGDLLWVKKWDSPFHLGDGGNDIALDDMGNVYVTGISWANHWNCVTIKYDTDGIEQWSTIYAGPGFDFDEARSIAIDNSGNVFITGRGGENGYGDYLTIKYSTNGDSLWAKYYDGISNDLDEAYSVAVDNSDNVYVTGRSLGITSGYDIVTIKYSPVGDSLWVRRFNGSANDVDEAYDIAVDNYGNVYVSGKSNTTGNSFDYVTIKYDTDGAEQWVRTYNGPEYAYDIAYSIVLDDSGNAYVTGESNGGSPGYVDFATVKYNTNGVEQWVERFNGAANNLDIGRSIAVDGSGNVYVTGESVGSGTEYDFATIKYSQNPTGIYENENELPEKFVLNQNYPNPFNPSTTISFSVPSEEFVSLKVFNSLGEEVADLVDETKPAGNYSALFGADEFTSGVYFYTIKAGSFLESKKMLLLK